MKDEMLFENEWVSLRKITHNKGDKNHEYIYSHETRCGGKIVSILPYKRENHKTMFLLRKETTPPWGPMPWLSTITGGVESSHPIDDAVREVVEESGYEIEEPELVHLGTCRGTKSSDSEYFLYSVDLTGKDQGKILGDGSGLEDEGDVEWVEKDYLSECVDPMASVILVRMQRFMNYALI